MGFSFDSVAKIFTIIILAETTVFLYYGIQVMKEEQKRITQLKTFGI